MSVPSPKKRMPHNVRKKYIMEKRREKKRQRKLLKEFIRQEEKTLIYVEIDFLKEKSDDAKSHEVFDNANTY